MLFSFEESIGSSTVTVATTGPQAPADPATFPGFLCGSSVLDKDGVSSAAVVAEMASYLYDRKLTLTQQLHNIYQA